MTTKKSATDPNSLHCTSWGDNNDEGLRKTENLLLRKLLAEMDDKNNILKEHIQLLKLNSMIQKQKTATTHLNKNFEKNSSDKGPNLNLTLEETYANTANKK